MDPAQLLRERERRLAAEYRASHPPRAFDGEDLQCQDLETAEHWVGVYTELVDFVHSLVTPLSLEHPSRAPGEPSPTQRAIELQAGLLELHLAYWTDRLDRLREHPDPRSR
ncbi:MAG: hypothetical protein J2P43_02735 [Candidatus Dormibacteraeota bacterium]|nr:hypothetical protein [Candidatus Dormibacteraeota bacterium]